MTHYQLIQITVISPENKNTGVISPVHTLYVLQLIWDYIFIELIIIKVSYLYWSILLFHDTFNYRKWLRVVSLNNWNYWGLSPLKMYILGMCFSWLWYVVIYRIDINLSHIYFEIFYFSRQPIHLTELSPLSNWKYRSYLPCVICFMPQLTISYEWIIIAQTYLHWNILQRVFLNRIFIV